MDPAAAQSSTPAYAYDSPSISDGAEDVLHAWGDALGSRDQMARKWKWAYLANASTARILLMRDTRDGMPVGAVGMLARPMQFEAREVSARLLCDFSVDERHRKGLAVLQFHRQATRAALEGVDLVFGMPNQRAKPLFSRHGFREVGKMRRRVCILRHGRYFARFVAATLAYLPGEVADVAVRAWRGHWRRGLKHQWAGIPALAEADSLWPRCVRQELLQTRKDTAALMSRFPPEAGRDYRVLLLSAKDDGQRCALAVVEFLGDLAHLRSLAWVGSSESLLETALVEVARACRQAGASGLSFEAMLPGDLDAATGRAGFVVRAERPVFATAATPDAIPPAGAWLLQAGDEDE